jgi:hypothetical protein
VSRKPQTRYPHAFSKGKGPGFHSEGSWRGARFAAERAAAKMSAEQEAQAAAKPLYPMRLDPRRWRYLKISPTIASLYKSHLGVAVICADCCRGVGHRNPGLPDRFKRQWHLTLMEVEQRCRCEACGSRNARVYPWAGGFDGPLGLEGPPQGGR